MEEEGGGNVGKNEEENPDPEKQKEELANKKAEQEKRKKSLLYTAEYIVESFENICKKYRNYLIDKWSPENIELNNEFMDGIETSLECYLEFHARRCKMLKNDWNV
jgi:hypothetical protein